MTEGRLFDDGPAPTGDPLMSAEPFVRRDAPETSRAAAKKAALRAGTDSEAVYSFVLSRGAYGANDDEIRDGTKGIVDPNDVTPRRVWLRDKGWVVYSGRTRPSRRGGPSKVWVAVGADQGGGA